LERVQRLVEDAAGGHTGGNPLQLDANRDLDALVRGDAHEVDVQDVLAEMIPLQVANQRLFQSAIQAQVDHVRTVSNQVGEFLGGQRDGDRLLLVPVDDAGDLSLIAKVAGLAGASALALLHFQLDGLGHDRFSNVVQTKREHLSTLAGVPVQGKIVGGGIISRGSPASKTGSAKTPRLSDRRGGNVEAAVIVN